MDVEQLPEEWDITDSTLTMGEKRALDDEGYLLFPGLVDAVWLAQLQRSFERAVGQGQGSSRQREGGTRHVNDLAPGDDVFEGVYTHPKVLAAAHHVLQRPFRLFQLAGRDPLPGFGQQGLHNDWLPRKAGDPYSMVTTLWLLNDFTPTNGATRVIPGSHRMPGPLPKSMQAPESHHPDEKVITAEAGSVLVLNGHLWHSGTRNNSNGSRAILQCQFVGREIRRTTEVPEELAGRLGPVAAYILGFPPSPF